MVLNPKRREKPDGQENRGECGEDGRELPQRTFNRIGFISTCTVPPWHCHQKRQKGKPKRCSKPDKHCTGRFRRGTIASKLPYGKFFCNCYFILLEVIRFRDFDKIGKRKGKNTQRLGDFVLWCLAVVVDKIRPSALEYAERARGRRRSAAAEREVADAARLLLGFSRYRPGAQ